MKRAKLLPSMIDISDDYINWLFSTNAGMLYRGNLYCLDYPTKNVRLKPSFFEYYNYRRYHDGLGDVTTCDVSTGTYLEVLPSIKGAWLTPCLSRLP
jgi:hypothetical protein